MKILFTFGGMPHYLNAMLEKLHHKGADIIVVTPYKESAIIGKGVKTVDSGSYRHLKLPEKKMWYSKNGFSTLPQIVKQECPDIVVLGWPYFLQIFFQPTLRRSIKACGARLLIREIPFQTPPYGQIRSYFQKHPMYNEAMKLQSQGSAFYLRQWLTAQIRRFCYHHADATLNYSTAAYDILPSYGVHREHIHVTYNATDTEALLREKITVMATPPLLPTSSRRLLHIGRLVKWKRVDLLIDAFAQVRQEYPDAELVIVGNGPELDALKQQVKQLGIPLCSKESKVPQGCVRFIGAVYDPKELGAYMYESSIYVLAGMGGLSINDAMTYGLPILCSVCDSTEQDLVVNGVNGFFFKEGNVNSLIDKIKEMFASPERCIQMGQASEKIIQEKINIDIVSERYLQAFQAVLKQ